MYDEMEFIKKAYDDVFDATGCVRVCGRQTCSKLITALQPYSKESLGDPSTGIMRVAEIQRTFKKVCNSAEKV